MQYDLCSFCICLPIPYEFFHWVNSTTFSVYIFNSGCWMSYLLIWGIVKLKGACIFLVVLSRGSNYECYIVPKNSSVSLMDKHVQIISIWICNSMPFQRLGPSNCYGCQWSYLKNLNALRCLEQINLQLCHIVWYSYLLQWTRLTIILVGSLNQCWGMM